MVKYYLIYWSHAIFFFDGIVDGTTYGTVGATIGGGTIGGGIITVILDPKRVLKFYLVNYFLVEVGNSWGWNPPQIV